MGHGKRALANNRNSWQIAQESTCLRAAKRNVKPIVIPELGNKQSVTRDLINHSVYLVDAPRPITGEARHIDEPLSALSRRPKRFYLPGRGAFFTNYKLTCRNRILLVVEQCFAYGYTCESNDYHIA
jgi:hypothetical protein